MVHRPHPRLRANLLYQLAPQRGEGHRFRTHGSHGNGSGALYISTAENIQQRAALLLKNVRYVIEAHFEMTAKAAPDDNPSKFQSIVTRRAQKGQFYHQPYFGCREFPAHFRLCDQIPPCPEEVRGKKDLGWMLYDMDYADPENIVPLFFRATLQDGVLEVPARDSEEVRG